MYKLKQHTIPLHAKLVSFDFKSVHASSAIYKELHFLITRPYSIPSKSKTRVWSL